MGSKKRPDLAFERLNADGAPEVKMGPRSRL